MKITGTTVVKFICVLVGLIGVLFIILNLIGFTDLSWNVVGSLFVAPFIGAILHLTEKRGK